MNARYVVTNRLGATVAGQRLNQGDEVFLSNEDAAPLLAASAIQRGSATPATSASRTRRKASKEVEPSKA